MTPKNLDPNVIRASLEKHKGNSAAVARELGISRGTVHYHVKHAPEYIVKKESFRFDAEGNITGSGMETAIAPGDTFEVPPGYTVKGESALVNADGQIIQKWVKTRHNAEELTSLVNGLAEAFEKYKGKASSAFLVPGPGLVTRDLLTFYPVPDLHMGMYAWGPETGDDYDTEIAKAVASKAITSLVSRSAASHDAVLLIKGDFFHQNDQKNVTPRSGHRLDVDGRWDKVYMTGAELTLQMINCLLQKHQKVELVIIPGNHDEDAAVTLRVAMSLYFKDHARVSVYSKPGLFWYRLFGATLLGSTHGHTMKDPKDMALAMAADCAAEWSQAKYRQIFTGHIHHERSREVGPVRWESFQTLAPSDAYSRGAGYRSGRSLTAITFHLDQGEVGRHRENIPFNPTYAGI